MELVSPSHPPGPANNFLSWFSLPTYFGRGFDRRNRAAASQPLPVIVEAGSGGVFVTVGRSVAKTVALLQWTVKMFPNHEVCILHVHQPSAFIPTLLGKLPASQANAAVVSAFRNQEWEDTRKLLNNLKILCHRAKIKASFITTEADQVQRGIVDLVIKYNIQNLVIGAAPDCIKVRKSSRKASYAAKYAPFFCTIWFINRRKLVWTRQSSETSRFTAPCSQIEPLSGNNFRSRSFHFDRGGTMFQTECLRSSSCRNLIHSEMNWFPAGNNEMEEASTAKLIPERKHVPSSTSYKITSSELHNVKVEEENLFEQLAEDSKSELISELLECEELEAKAIDAINETRSLESVHEREIKLRIEAEDALKVTIQEQEKLVEEREELTRKLQKAMRNIALLDSRAQEANRRCKEVGGELKLIQASIATLRHEKKKLQRQKTEALNWIDQWKSHGKAARPQINELIGDSTEIAEFSFSDLQTATCNFSESFRIGHGGYGAVYKGELLGMTVAIKKMHPHNARRLSDFHQQVELLSKACHPHLVSLIGICQEACSLVYEYLPGGNLQERLFNRSMIPLSWKTRSRIISEIASALFFLHTYPEEIVHGDLKPENILLDSNNHCKVSDYGIYRLVPEQIHYCPSSHPYTEPKGAVLYMDPDFHRAGIVTPKSDIYSFGLLILQLLTGRTPGGLAYEVRKAISCRKISSILDPSAGEWSTFVARRLMELGLQCCELNSRDRPELTPVLLNELDHLHALEDKPIPSFFLCPILQEMMHDPQVAADGFTYEGEALRGWLENGHDTSPMTNLKLSHLELTPNHALRLSIQEWLGRA